MQLSISSIGSVILTYLSYCSAFKITKFEVPSEVRIGSTAKLVCEYELAPYRQLYTLRWLRNNVEFYRYDPALTPRHNYYKTHGLHVNVSKSNGTILYIDHASKEDTEGSYTCEVTTFPNFARTSESKRMEVTSYAEDALGLKKDHEGKDHQSYRKGRKLGSGSTGFLLSKRQLLLPFILTLALTRVNSFF